MGSAGSLAEAAMRKWLRARALPAQAGAEQQVPWVQYPKPAFGKVRPRFTA